MQLVDLFCGGGGSSSGFHQAGFDTSMAFDLAWHCVKTYNSNFGNVAVQADLSQIRYEPIIKQTGSKPMLVTASPPCEPFTTANVNRLKNPYDRFYNDNTGGLMLHAIRLIADLDPDFFMIENVKGILEGESKQILLEELERVGIDSPYFHTISAPRWGIASHRTRILITNFKISEPNVKERTVMDAIGDLPDPNYPYENEFHKFTPVSPIHQKKMITLPPGEGLIYFRGIGNDLKNYIRLHENRPAPVIMGKSRFIHPIDDRLLTPLEHARLMGFPDSHIYCGTREEIYDVIGEAVPPKITFEIGKQILNQL
ncbi:MAG: DNA cytosine methyltransferase [Candidatus Kariarchaeaceae archaeon]